MTTKLIKHRLPDFQTNMGGEESEKNKFDKPNLTRRKAKRISENRLERVGSGESECK